MGEREGKECWGIAIRTLITKYLAKKSPTEYAGLR